MSRVLILTTNFWPEPTGIAIYSTDLAKTIQSNGFEVTIFTGIPHYPWWRVPREFEHITPGESFLNGVRIVRTRHYIPSKVNALIRFLFEISLWFNLVKSIRKISEQNIVSVIAFIPTIAAGLVGKKIAKKIGVPLGLIIQDLSGLGATQSGLKGGQLFSRLAKFIERRLILSASRIVTISPAMTKRISEFGVLRDHITQIGNYSVRIIKPENRLSSRQAFGWSEDMFIVIHSGNMGSKQNLENVIDAAHALEVEKDVKIFLVGHGNQETKLKILCLDKPNIQVMEAVSEENFSRLLASADILLINERYTQTEMSLPSKITSYLRSGRPVLAAVPRYGSTWEYLEGIAELVEAGNPHALANAILRLKKDESRRSVLAEKGLKFAAQELNPGKAQTRYMNWVRDLVDDGNKGDSLGKNP